MGYAVFTARKLMLTSRINNLNFRLMCLSQQKQSLAQLSSTMQSSFGQLSMNMNSMCQQNLIGAMLGGSYNGTSGNNQTQMMNYMGNMYQMQLNNNYIQQMQQSMMAPVAMQDNAIDMEMKTIETQLQAARAELDSVEKHEGEEIKKSAPKFA